MTTPQDNTESGIDIRSLWSVLDPATRQWFMDHTGNSIVFIRAHSAFAAYGTERFFEAVQPKDASQAYRAQHTDLPHRT